MKNLLSRKFEVIIFFFCMLNRMITIQTRAKCRAHTKPIHCLPFVLFIWSGYGQAVRQGKKQKERGKKGCTWVTSCEKAYTLWYADRGWCGSWIQDSLVFMATVCPSSFTSLSSIATAGELSGASLIQVCIDKKQKKPLCHLALDRHYKKYVPDFYLFTAEASYFF